MIGQYGTADHEAWLIEMEREDEAWGGFAPVDGAHDSEVMSREAADLEARMQEEHLAEIDPEAYAERLRQLSAAHPMRDDKLEDLDDLPF